MDGGHQTLNNTEFVVDDLGKRSETISGTRCIGNLGIIEFSLPLV